MMYSKDHPAGPAFRSERNLSALASAALLALAGLPATASAQVTPDAGALQQQIERDRAPLLPRAQRPALTLPAPTAATPGPVVSVKTFRFVGNTLVSTDALAPTVAPYLNRALSYAELQAAVAAVAQAYRDAGWIVRAYLPQQDVTDGIVTIQIVEAVFGQARIETEAPRRVSTDRLQRMARARQVPGQPMSAPAMDRALLLLDDLPGITATGSLAPGQQDNATDLVLRTTDEPLVSGAAELANTGSRSTGASRASVNLALNSALGLGDLLGASAMATEGSQYLRLAASLPVGADGWRVGVNSAALRYRLISPDFTGLDGHGSSHTLGAEAMVPLLRSRAANAYLNLNAEHKRFDNLASGAVTTRYAANVAALGLAANAIDALGGGGVTSATLILTRGWLNLSGSPHQAADATTTRAAGRYNVLRYSANRQQTLTDTVSFFAALAGQATDRNLDSSEKFYLGGASGVRAYPSSEAGGSEGQLLNLELRWRLPAGFTASAFYDAGQVRQQRHVDFAGAPAQNNARLSGAGASVAWQAPTGAAVRLTWARRIGQNPFANALNGHDQDGSRRLHRLWVSASLPF